MNNQTKQATQAPASKEGRSYKKIGAIVVTAAIIGTSVWAFGFTAKGRIIVRVITDPAPAVDAYAAKDAWTNQFQLQVANPKAN